MKRRKAIGGILAITGLGIASFKAFNFFLGTSNRGTLINYEGLISDLAETIIPTTETPGAKEAGVQNFIIDYMEACASNKEFNRFYNGLNDVQDLSVSRYNAIFENCTAEQKYEVLKDFDDSGDSNGLLVKIDTKIRGRSFFKNLKALTIEGYCTSEMGATQMLTYDPIPMEYAAITTLQPNQKAWATR